MPVTATLRINNVPALLRKIKTVTRKQLYVGVPQEKTRRNTETINNATLAYLNEHGSAVNNIPPRPFLAPGFASVEDKVVEQLQQGMSQALVTTRAAQVMDAGLNAAGLAAQSGIKNFIRAGLTPPPADSTIRARLRKGHHGTKPLIVTGSLINSIFYVVEDRDGSD